MLALQQLLVMCFKALIRLHIDNNLSFNFAGVKLGFSFPYLVLLIIWLDAAPELGLLGLGTPVLSG